MSKSKAVITGGAILAIAALWIWTTREKQAAVDRSSPQINEVSSPQETGDGKAGENPIAQSTEMHPAQSDLPAAHSEKTPLPPSGRVDLADPLAPASVPDGPVPRAAEEDSETAIILDKVALMIRDYRTITGENPIGTNAEIMKAMMGKNPRGATLGPPEGMSLNGEGELLDRWGTPIFFHQISRDVMEIHSAGPDQRMGTDDDLILK